jgi:hypothetical protein
MVWKKSRRSCKDSKKLIKTVVDESQQQQPKLKSCLKKFQETLSVSDQELSSQNESDYKISSGDGSSSSKEANRSAASTNGSRSVESRASAESSSLQRLVHHHHSTDHMSSSTTEESSTDDNGVAAQSQSQTSDQSGPSSGLQCGTKKKFRFNAIQIRDYERIVGDNPSCTTGPPLS